MSTYLPPIPQALTIDVGLRFSIEQNPDGTWCGSVRDCNGKEMYTCHTKTSQQALADTTEAARAIRREILELMARNN